MFSDIEYPQNLVLQRLEREIDCDSDRASSRIAKSGKEKSERNTNVLSANDKNLGDLDARRPIELLAMDHFHRIRQRHQYPLTRIVLAC